MAPNFPTPRLLKKKQNTQLSYDLPQRIHTAKTYPIKSSNGSSIIIYGHEQGVKIVWRGGRAFKAPAEPAVTASKKSNGADNAIILLDSDDEDQSTQAFQDKPEFEDDEEELDDSRPYPDTLQVLDLYFGTDVLHLSLLPASILRADGPKWRNLTVLKEKIVFTAACADNLVRLITLPLTPPSPTSKARPDFRSNFTQANTGNGSWGETVRLLGGHHKPSDGVSMTLDFVRATLDESKTDWTSGANIIIASHSREMAGLLQLFRVPISSASPHFEPFQTIYLPTPAQSISFSPSLSGHRSSQLLVADAIGSCRIFDFKLLVKSPTEEPVAENIVEQGTWLISLYPGFQNNKGDTSLPQYTGTHADFGRKVIVDAKWVSGGKAVVVLLDDGEWGIWDIEGVGPGASQGLLGRQSIKGGSLSAFSLSGFVDGTTKSRSSGPPQIGVSKFAPMTPGTRKSIEPFGGKALSGPLRGQISVVEVPSSSPTSAAEDSIVFWLGESFTVIPSLAKYWVANARKSAAGNSFNGPPGSRLTKLEGIDLQGERCAGIDQIVKDNSTGLPSDILILGEHRFTVLTTGQAKPLFQFTGQPMQLDKRPTDGELDVVGIDQALLRMENGGRNGFAAKLKGGLR